MNSPPPQLQAAHFNARYRLAIPELLAQDAHRYHVQRPAVAQAVAPQQTLSPEAAFLVAADAAGVIGVGDQPDAPQPQLSEGVVQDAPDGVRAVATAPAVLLADGDSQLRTPAGRVDLEQADSSNGPAV